MTHTPDSDTPALAADPERPVPRRVVFHQIRLAVYRLAVSTTTGELTASGRSLVTRPPLLTELREAIRPNQGGTGAGGSAPSTRIGFDATAYDLYREIVDQISSAYETATDRQPTDTPEMLLLEWFIELEVLGRIKDGLSDAQLLTQHARVRQWQTRIEDQFNPPRTGELPKSACLSCSETHAQHYVDGSPATINAVYWTHTPERGLLVHCRACGTTWTQEDLHLLDRYRWTARRTARTQDLKTPLTGDDWHHIRLDLRQRPKIHPGHDLWQRAAIVHRQEKNDAP